MFIQESLIELAITAIGVGFALFCENILRGIYESKRDTKVLDYLKHEFLVNVAIADRIINRVDTGDLRFHIYSTNVWDSLISSGILFKFKLQKETTDLLSKIYTRIRYANLIEDIIADIYLEKNERDVEPARKEHIFKKRKEQAEAIKKYIGKTNLIIMDSVDTDIF
jgi:hypothetical protein